MTGNIQGQDAVLSFFVNDWIPFVCSSDITVEVAVTRAPTRTAGDGHWKKYTYQDCEYSITLSGVLKFDDINFSGWDMLDNAFNFTDILFRCSFDDHNGNIKTIQGRVLVETSTLTSSIGALVKNDFQLQGNGKLDLFDGLIPCPTSIDSITVDGQTAADGIVHVTYDYTGDLYQVKYRVDGVGDYAYALGAVQLDIPGLSLGAHSIEIIPVCSNNYPGTSLMQAFTVTQALTCTSVITAITVNTASTPFATCTSTGAATQMQYSIDGGTAVVAPIGQQIPLGGLTPGAHSITIVPLCSINGQLLPGIGLTQGFTISSTPSQSIISYVFEPAGAAPSNNSFFIYVNGILTVQSATGGSGSISVPIGATIRASMQAVPIGSAPKHLSLDIADQTTSTTLFNRTVVTPNTIQFQFTANGDNYFVQQTITD